MGSEARGKVALVETRKTHERFEAHGRKFFKTSNNVRFREAVASFSTKDVSTMGILRVAFVARRERTHGETREFAKTAHSRVAPRVRSSVRCQATTTAPKAVFF
jgi:hypothetical protein